MINKDSTWILKGVAIIFMLMHHLFYSPTRIELFDDISMCYHGCEYGLVNQIGIYGKLCVALFCFLSGYGLAVSKSISLTGAKDFYIKRFVKLYLNYWFVWLIFVPIGVLLFNRTFIDAYGEQHWIASLILDILGLLSLTGGTCYNPTWWFYSCIIILYLLFPIIHKRCHKNWFVILSIGIIIPFFQKITFIAPIALYLLPFVVGIYIARVPISIFKEVNIWYILGSFLMLSLIRNFSGNMVFIVDTFLCVSLAILVYRVELPRWLKTVMISLGKHSMNIFLIHTFILSQWFTYYTYISRSPLIILIQLILICYFLSLVIEYIKNKIGFNIVLNKIVKHQEVK